MDKHPDIDKFGRNIIIIVIAFIAAGLLVNQAVKEGWFQ